MEAQIIEKNLIDKSDDNNKLPVLSEGDKTATPAAGNEIIDKKSSIVKENKTEIDAPSVIEIPEKDKSLKDNNKPAANKIKRIQPNSSIKNPSSIPVAVSPQVKPTTTTKPTKGGGTYSNQSSNVINKGPDKKTLEIQFIKNKKLLVDMNDQLVEKQRPIKEKYKSLLRIQKQLEDLGKKVTLSDIHFEFKIDDEANREKKNSEEEESEFKQAFKAIANSFEELNKRISTSHEEIVKYLSTTSNIDVQFMNNLKENFFDVYGEQEKKIAGMIEVWQNASTSKKEDELQNINIKLEEKIREQEKQLVEYYKKIEYLNKKLEELKINYEKHQADEKKKFESELSHEKRNNFEAYEKIKLYKLKIVELERKLKDKSDADNINKTQLKQMEEKMHETEVEFAKEKADLNKKIELFEKRRLTMDKRVTFLENQETILTQEKEELKQSIEKMHHIKTDLTKENVSLKEKIDKLDDKLQIITSNGSLEDEVKHLRSLMDNQNKELEKVRDELKNQKILSNDLQMAKDASLKYANTLRETLREANDELHLKTKTIYKLHETMLIKDSACEEMKEKIVQAERKCQICGKRNWEALGLNSDKHEKLMTESLIGMSVEKLNDIRAKLDKLR